MRELWYVSASGEEVCLDGDGAFTHGALALRGRKWSYELGSRSLAAATRDARECSVGVSFSSLAQADLLRSLADRDMALGEPGRLVAAQEWEQRAFVTGFEPSAHLARSGYLSGELEVALLDGVWRRWSSADVRREADQEGDALDLPHGFPHDYAAPPPSAIIDVGGLMPCPVRLTVFGPAASPKVTIGENAYSFSATVPSGGRLVCDGSSFPKTIALYAADGSAEDAFACGERGSGEGSGEYCFEPLAPGRLRVARSASFDVRVEWCEEEGEPPWSS